MNANLKADTTDGLLRKKKDMHLSAFQYRIDEIKDELQVPCFRFQFSFTRVLAPVCLWTWWVISFLYLRQKHEDDATKRLSIDNTAPKNAALYTVENFIAKIVEQCQKVYSKHESIPPESYIQDGVFRGLVWEMVELQVNSYFLFVLIPHRTI